MLGFDITLKNIFILQIVHFKWNSCVFTLIQNNVPSRSYSRKIKMADSHDHDVDFVQKRKSTTLSSTKSQRFSCRFEGCDSSFSKKAHLTRHEMIHNDVVSNLKIKCPYCLYLLHQSGIFAQLGKVLLTFLIKKAFPN